MSGIEDGVIDDVASSVHRIMVEEGLSGVVRVDVDGDTVVADATGSAHRGFGIENTVDTRFAIASGSKAFTALSVMSLVERGLLGLDTTARSILGDDLPLIDDRVTVEHLLAHRSGIGDYLDEDEVNGPDDYLMPVGVHELATTDDYLAILDGHATKFAPGERFSYCNGGYVVLAAIAERVSGLPFHDLVDEVVLRPAGMVDTAYLRSDALPERTALNYLDDDGARTNIFHLPVRGHGDGGAFSTASDIHRFWRALTNGEILPHATVTEMMRPRSDVSEQSMRYGLGLWIDPATPAVSIHGFDTGVGFVSVHDPSRPLVLTVMSNKTRGAWPCSRRIAALLAGLT